jgi:hypothetical protein
VVSEKEKPPNYYVFCRGCAAGGPTGKDEKEATEKFKTRRVPRIEKSDAKGKKAC